MNDPNRSRDQNAQADDVILRLEKISKIYPSGEEMVTVLHELDLEIRRGEMVAIIGPSGSGKSTLMNILGCLDNASSGKYEVSNQDVSTFDTDQLASFRRNHYGFIFQRYHLLSSLTAVGNVEIPAIYSGLAPSLRHKRAVSLLTRLGMADRINHRPNQLSGGQQQRVSIARALMNGGEIILADEPTGALDRHSGAEVLKILDELHQEGRTIIIVTHDSNVAARAERIIELSDGKIIRDEPNIEKLAESALKRENSTSELKIISDQAQNSFENPALSHRKQGFFGFIAKYRSQIDMLWEAFMMAMLSLKAHPMRTFLTMLGIIIGISAVISMVALGNGATAKIMENMSGLSANTLTIFPGASMADRNASKITTLTTEDLKALARQPYVTGVTPTIAFNTTVSSDTVTGVSGMVSGVSAQSVNVNGLTIVKGHFFDAEAEKTSAQEVVLEEDSVATLFPNSQDSPINKIIVVGSLPMRIVGTYKSNFGQTNNSIQLYIPFTTAQARFFGANISLASITVRVKDDIDTQMAQAMITKFLTMRHGTKDFFILNVQELRERIMSSFEILTLFVSAIAVISLLVGGIGVMNIMLVTVSERINEIGVRMAVGARRRDILQQFLIEAVVVCILGGLIGVGLSLLFGFLMKVGGAPIPVIYSAGSILGAVFFSSLIGISFGYLPARNAARLAPVEALARD